MHFFAGRLQNELQVLYDRETRLLCQPDRHQIINQIHSLPERDKLTNVVMMGMGEPLDNLEEVLKAWTY